MRARLAARPCLVALFVVLGSVGHISGAGAERPPAQGRLRDALPSAPLGFEANGGQTDAKVKYLARGNGYSVFLTATETVLSFAQGRSSSAVIRMTLAGATAPTATSGVDRLPGRNHDLAGSDPRRWRTDISTFAKVRYEDVYPGIDVVYSGNQRQLAYDFIVAPRADPRQIRLRIEGADDTRIDAAGDLVLRVGNHEVRQRKPKVYQGADGMRREVSGGYELTAAKEVRFVVGGFDRSQPLIIDPVLAYASYLGGTREELALISAGIAVDRAGNAYVTGWTASTDFPTTAGAFQSTSGGGDIQGFVSKFDPTGSVLLYSTYLGGSGSDVANDIAVDEAGYAYVTGNTSSPDFPTTPGAYASPCTSCAFVSKLDPSGASLVYSARMGPAGALAGASAFAIAVDDSGQAYIIGNTEPGFPVTSGSFQPNYGGGQLDGFVLKLNGAGSGLVYSSFLGGTELEQLYDIALDRFGSSYVTGGTNSADFPTTPGAFQRSCFVDPRFGTCSTAFLTRIDSSGSTVAYSTYFGDGFGVRSTSVAVDAAGHPYIAGYAGTIPTTPGALQPLPRGSTEAFLTKFDVTGSSLVYSTYLGGSAEDGIEGLAVDASGQAAVSGWTWSTDFPVVNPIQSTLRGSEDAFVARFNPSGTALVFSTYLGGSSNDGGGAGGGLALDRRGDIYVVGLTSSTDFPVVNGAQPAYAGEQDYFVAKIAERSSLCPPDVTESLDIHVSPTFPFLFPALQLQLVLVYNKTATPIEGPLAFVLDDLANGIPLSPPILPTTCTSAGGAVYFLLHPGGDEVLAPGELTGAWVLFLKSPEGPITYAPRVLGGVPTR